MTIQECKRRERIYKKLVEKFLPTFTFDSKNCTPEELECIKVALLRSVAIEMLNIADLKKRKDSEPMFEEKIIWHEITTSPLTEEEKAEYAERGYADYEIPEYMISGEMPKDGQEILVATSWGVSQDLCMIDFDECDNLFELETRGDWDGVKAWAAMPKYKGGDSDA